MPPVDRLCPAVFADAEGRFGSGRRRHTERSAPARRSSRPARNLHFRRLSSVSSVLGGRSPWPARTERGRTTLEQQQEALAHQWSVRRDHHWRRERCGGLAGARPPRRELQAQRVPRDAHGQQPGREQPGRRRRRARRPGPQARPRARAGAPLQPWRRPPAPPARPDHAAAGRGGDCRGADCGGAPGRRAAPGRGADCGGADCGGAPGRRAAPRRAAPGRAAPGRGADCRGAPGRRAAPGGPAVC